MRARYIGAVLAVVVGCAGALMPLGPAASAQERGAAGRGAGGADTAPGPGRGFGRGRGPAPDEPRGVRVKTDAATPGYLLFAPLNSDTTFLIDNDGQVVRTWKSDVSPGAAVVMLDSGSIVRAGFEPKTAGFNGGGQGGRFQEFTFDGELVWEFSINDASRLAHHDFAVMPNGNILAIVWDLKSADEARRVGRRDGFIPAGGVWPDVILELQPQRPKGARIVWEWHAWDHLIQDVSPSMPNYAKPSERPERIDVNGDVLGAKPGGSNVTADILHTNAIAYNAELDQIVLSVPRFNELWIIDHSTTSAQARGSSGGRYGRGGDLLYRWGNPQVYGRGTEADRRLGFQHDTRWIPRNYPGGGHMMVFSNRGGGAGPNAGRTTVYEIATPVDANGRYTLDSGRPFGPTEPVWTYAAPDLQAQFISGATRLADGKTLVSSGPQGRVFEITPDGRIVWEFWSPFTGSLGGAQGKANPYALFRASRIPMNHPALKGRTLRPLTPQPPLASPGTQNP
jgi:hypothetical protein